MSDKQSDAGSATLALSGLHARQYNDLELSRLDIAACQRILKAHGSEIIPKPTDLGKMVWVAIMTKYFSCFGSSASRSSLDPKLVFKGNDQALKDYYRLRNIRNKHIAHDENNLIQCNICVETNNTNSNRKLLCLVTSAEISEKDVLQMESIIEITTAFIEEKLNNLSATLQAQVDGMTQEQIAKLKPWSYDAKDAMFHPEKKRTRLD